MLFNGKIKNGLIIFFVLCFILNTKVFAIPVFYQHFDLELSTMDKPYAIPGDTISFTVMPSNELDAEWFLNNAEWHEGFIVLNGFTATINIDNTGLINEKQTIITLSNIQGFYGEKSITFKQAAVSYYNDSEDYAANYSATSSTFILRENLFYLLIKMFCISTIFLSLIIFIIYKLRNAEHKKKPFWCFVLVLLVSIASGVVVLVFKDNINDERLFGFGVAFGIITFFINIIFNSIKETR